MNQDLTKLSDQELQALYSKKFGNRPIEEVAKELESKKAQTPQVDVNELLRIQQSPGIASDVGNFLTRLGGKEPAQQSGDLYKTYMEKILGEQAKSLYNNQNSGRAVYSFNPNTGELERVADVQKGDIVRNQMSPEDIAARESAKSEASYGTPGEIFDRGTKLRTEFQGTDTVKDFQIIRNQVAAMEALVNNPEIRSNPSRIAREQGVITLFNKVTDPQSVVRESEYARTPEGLSLANRFSGAFQKLKFGGAGLTDQDLEALLFGAKVIANSRGSLYNDVLKNYIDLSTRGGVDPSMVTSGYGQFEPFAFEQKQDLQEQDPQAQQGGIPAVGGMFNGQRVKKVTKIG